MESHGAVYLSVGRSVGRSVSQSVVISQQEREKRVYFGRLLMRKMRGERRKEAEGSINIEKCQDTRRRPINTTTYLPHQERCPLTFYTTEE